MDLLTAERLYADLKHNKQFQRHKLHWSKLVKPLLKAPDQRVRWIGCRCFAIITGMNEVQLHRFLASEIGDPEVVDSLTCQYETSGTFLSSSGNVCLENQDNLIDVFGVKIPCKKCKLVDKGMRNAESFILTKTTCNNLRKIAFGISSRKAVCLRGTVGSGKTSLVEFLAERTGRKLGEDFIKVQLGDQTDGKMLLGTYRCTDVPGEFIWQPGVLTQAVIEGHWLLLEDIDSASMDIASLLTSLLDSNTLSVPGYRDSVTVSPGFHLFVTERLLSNNFNSSQRHSSSMALLWKHLHPAYIDPLTSEELQQVIKTMFPLFDAIADRMVKIYLLFTKKGIMFNPNQSSLSVETMDTDRNTGTVLTEHEIVQTRSGRMISTRDLFKWCWRVTEYFDVSSPESALRVLQDAIDIFCCSYPDSQEVLTFAKQISTYLGISNQKAEYFLNNYKPAVSVINQSLSIGRAKMSRDSNNCKESIAKFCFTRPASVLLERILCCIGAHEPVLLVGETGTGKTSSLQYLAHMLGQKLIVINMNQQSDSADLLGGFKPVDFKFIVSPIRTEFENVFSDYFKIEPNKKYLGYIALCFNDHRWIDLLKLMDKSTQTAVVRLKKQLCDVTDIREKLKKEKMLQRWLSVDEELKKLSVQLKQKNALAFSFIEGSLVKAVENGYWVLLDEINLANAETLECLSGLLESSKGSICLLEKGDKRPIKRHKNFKLFACMNPSTDVGKKDLPAGLRNRFTEFFVDELIDRTDLCLLVDNYLTSLSLKQSEINNVVEFYLKVRNETMKSLSDGVGHKPHYSLRTLCRALVIASKNPCHNYKRNFYEAFCLSFLTQLDSTSYNIVQNLISRTLVGDDKTLKSILNQPIPEPIGKIHNQYLNFEGYWVQKGHFEPSPPDDYILTPSVRKNLKDLTRVVSIGKLPVLLQGDTSVGKTSLIMYLAKSTGNKCVRINNHEHTDLQEYVGSYIADVTGKLVFREGLLVEAMRNGHWIILDELNLAPTDVLEALNRVLDDNRELFIPETQEVIKANPNFMLFATQNPPGTYGGRKMLSRAFRNRFVELHFGEIPPQELETILQKRCQISPSHAKKMVNVMKELQIRRRESAVFAGKQGFMTLRDLFRWGERHRLAKVMPTLYDWDQHLADEGYLVLAGRVRKAEEKQEIVQVLKLHLKRDVIPNNLFTLSETTSSVTKEILEKIRENESNFKNIVWTYNMRQLAVLVAKAFQFKEPVLLVGHTGGGKTTACQLITEMNKQKLITVNCHMHIESSDFIGGLRPVRDHLDNGDKLFEWIDGPIVQAMVDGCVFLADEISLADDSVLERLNSLLEPERTLLVAEKGCDINAPQNSELIIANENFYFVGTMNPGGDYGKKELSPALRNRFTEIWCESCTDRTDLISIIDHNIARDVQVKLGSVGTKIMDFVEWFKETKIGKRFTISIRDILTWVSFINACVDKVNLRDCYLQGACLTFLDSFGSGVTSNESTNSLQSFMSECFAFISDQLKCDKISFDRLKAFSEHILIERTTDNFGISPFYIEMGENDTGETKFSFDTPTTLYNTLRVLRAMQLKKAILLEGSPGVGKTSLITALAKASKHNLFRVNLSDQTDISDLFGADLPVEGGKGGQFSWRDGPLLQALKQGDWILLDELNLASQSVLEGLNACLDHRGEIFIPELGKVFYVRPGTHFFACQNPQKQGGSRRGLPQSFLNRFTQVYITSLTSQDLKIVLSKQFPLIPIEILESMIKFNSKITQELDNHTFGNKGSPWEFNLRDLTRWCQIMVYHNNDQPEKAYRPQCSVELIYSDRMRTLNDRIAVGEIFEEVFSCKIPSLDPVAYVSKEFFYVGDACVKRNVDCFNENVIKDDSNLVLRSQLGTLRNLIHCVNVNWMAILVGNSGSGKSSVVRTLAAICGKSLKTLAVTSAMDTTDILGGFEQTDYTRHLDELVKETERLVLENVQHLLLKSSTLDEATDLLGKWDHFNTLGASKSNGTMEEETARFVSKLEALKNLFCSLENLTCFLEFEKTKQLLDKCSWLNKSIKEEKSLNAGGKFEWIDSVLVKCLQNGSWLLVDNVNLCSAAVLDRLNALLEPNGLLIINERGVDSEGRMVEIKPHEDFRLFLTMDPKNGEISRAMRNRGVEIYMLDDKELDFMNQYDMRSLISHQGIHDDKVINMIIESHKKGSLACFSEKPNITDLVRASSFIAQELNNGSSDVQAIRSGFIETYLKSGRFRFSNIDDIVCKEIRDSEDQQDFYNKNVTMHTDALQVNSSIANIKQQGSVIEKFVQKHGSNNFDETFFITLVSFYYNLSNFEDDSLRKKYLQILLKEFDVDFKFFTTLNVKKFNYIQSLPLDCKWLPSISCNQELEYNRELEFFTNQVMLKLHINFVFDKLWTRKYDDVKISLFNYLKLEDSNTVQKVFHNCTIIDNILSLLHHYKDYTKCGLNSNVSEPQAVKIIHYFTYFIFFFNRLEVNIYKISDDQKEKIINDLYLHFKWFVKKALKQVSTILGVKLSQPLKLKIDLILNSPEHKECIPDRIARKYQKENDRPLPCGMETRPLSAGFSTINNNCEPFNTAVEKSDAVTSYISCYFKELLLRSVIRSPFITCIQDKKKLHESISSMLFSIMSSPATHPGLILDKYEDGNKYIVLRGHCPKLAYMLSEVLITENSFGTTLGNFCQLAEKHRYISVTVWRNMQQLEYETYDYVTFVSDFINENFRRFIEDLSASVGTSYDNQNINLREIESLAQFEGVSKEIFSSWIDRPEIAEDSNIINKLISISDLYIQLGYLKLVLDCSLPTIDPLAKKALKKKYCGEIIQRFKSMSKAFECQSAVFSNSSNVIHPLYYHVLQEIKELEEDNMKRGNCNVERPKDVSYSHVRKLVCDVLKTLLTEDKMKKVLDELSSICEDLSTVSAANDGTSKLPVINFKEYEMFCHNIEVMGNRWKHFRELYPDIIEPPYRDISELLFGLRLKLSVLQKLAEQLKNKNRGFDAHTLLSNLVKVPYFDESVCSYESLIKILYFGQPFCKFVEHTFVDNASSDIETPTSRLLKCGIQDTYNHCIIDAKYSRTLNKTLFLSFEELLSFFVNSWKNQLEEKEILEKEESALYKIKKAKNQTEEEYQIEEEKKELFPNYHDIDFKDLQAENQFSNDDEEEIPASAANVKTCWNDEQIKFIVDTHMTLITCFTKSEWLDCTSEIGIPVKFLEPLLEKFKLFKHLMRESVTAVDYTLDRELLGSFSILIHLCQKYGDTSEIDDVTCSPTRTCKKKSTNFYSEANVEEVKSSYHLLHDLKLKINEFLNEWPDHPTLKTISIVIERILGFDITSPLSRFLTGFEILLSKCYEWEQNAHSGVSLNEHFHNITKQIIAWRKKEMSMWKDLLNSTYQKLYDKCTMTWWLHLYNLMNQFLKEKSTTTEKLITTIQTFIAKSTLVEFQSRLNLLYVFHCHALYYESSPERDDFVNVLWNLYNYFDQFSPSVEERIKTVRAPIEQELKDHIKIQRWRDINYWSVKNAVDATHKMLHKSVREFKKVLNEPVVGCLTNVSGDKSDIHQGIWDRPKRSNTVPYHYSLAPDSYVAKISSMKQSSEAAEGIILGKVESYFLKSRKLCKETISVLKYPQLVQNLDSFLCEVIETSNHLQSLEVDSSLPLHQQKSRAKSVLQQKHRALADLFKNLSKLGLSYKRGIVESKMKPSLSNFLLKPINLKVCFSHFKANSRDDKILTIWESCEKYYLRTLIRADVLDTAMRNPAKDLGVQNLERCKGFSSHLLKLMQDQKVSLTETSRMFYYLRFYISQITNLCDATDNVKNKFVDETIVDKLKECLKTSLVVLSQLKLILNSCPDIDSFESVSSEITVLVPEPQWKIHCKDHIAYWSKASNCINDSTGIVNKLLQNLEKDRKVIPAKECNLNSVKFICLQDFQKKYFDEMESLQKELSQLHSTLGNLSFARNLIWLRNELSSVSVSLTNQPLEETLTSKESDEMKKNVEKLIEQLLITFQKVYKKHIVPSEQPNAPSAKIDENVSDDDSYVLVESHLKDVLVSNLFNDINSLDLKHIFELLHGLMNVLSTLSMGKLRKLTSVFQPCLPLLEQAVLFYQYFITQQVSAYRVSCKMNSILLNVFIELTTKGFCSPEFSDEKDSGSSQPSDGLGLGEGEGEKDVSDKIESEDQLEDAQPAGKEKDQKEDPDCKEEDNAIEMSENFDSKLQDVAPKEGEESGSETEAEEQEMGETEKNVDKLDEQIWGSDSEEEEGESQEKEEYGDGKEKEDKQLAAKEDESNKNDDENDPTSNEKENKSKKDINEMDEPEYDDDQIDPYHGNLPEPPEPEPMDLPEDMHVDDGQEDEDVNADENPLDIDTMKDQNVPEDNPNEEDAESEKGDNQQNDDVKEFSSDDEEITKVPESDNEEMDIDNDDRDPEQQPEGNPDDKQTEASMEDEIEDDAEMKEETGLDQTKSNEDRVEAMEVDNSEATDKTQANQSDLKPTDRQIDDLCQEDKPDKGGTGQSQMEESKTGHSAQTSLPEESRASKRNREDVVEKQNKPGESDSQRSLGDVNEPVQKKLKTVTSKDIEQKNDDDDDEIDINKEAEMFKHIKEAKNETTMTQVLDVATEEQIEKQKEIPINDEEAEKPTESTDELPSQDIEEDIDVLDESIKKDPEALEKSKPVDKQTKKQHREGEILDEMQDIEVEGEIVPTETVARSNETMHYTHYEDLHTLTTNNGEEFSQEEINNLRTEVERQLSAWKEPPPSMEAETTWQKISALTLSLAQDLCEQLRLVLEPTQASRLKGDFRTGRRINMRKVIPYIASQFRKDKIWLRRTKPSKRDYQIVLAIDDSSSMADNQSKELAFESVALISKALSLLESGEISVLSFGEQTEIIHKLSEPFTEKSGVKLLQNIDFSQKNTRVGNLVNTVAEMFNQCQSHSSAFNARLLVILSDGRGVFSEGESYVKQAVRKARLSNIFIVFVIVENSENKSSVLDIRTPIFKNGKLLEFKNYMDLFPFPFYIILRDIAGLPTVLSNALSQWFEMISNT